MSGFNFGAEGQRESAEEGAGERADWSPHFMGERAIEEPPAFVSLMCYLRGRSNIFEWG